MAIGVFGDTPGYPGGDNVLSTPLYWMYEWGNAALQPSRALAHATKFMFQNPLNPFAQTTFGKSMAAATEVYERATRRYAKPEWDISSTLVGGERLPVRIVPVWERPFCKLLHFERVPAIAPRRPQPKVLIVAPLSGHYATLLRGTVEAFLPNHDVYVTDWTDARMVPLSQGTFDLDDYIDYVTDIFHHFQGDCHVVAVCQPAVPVLAAVALMEADNDPFVPRSMTLMGGPIDTRINPTAVNKVAVERGIEWFRRHVIAKVPPPHPGFGRNVYPGFLQLTGFVSMNFERHLDAHRSLFMNLVKGDGDSVAKHQGFYDEYLAVMDLPARYYLQTVESAFIHHDLPNGTMMHRDRPVDLRAIHRVALLTVEGENDDISGLGQTEAAHALCPNIPAAKKAHYLQQGVGHYGVFNGSRFHAEIQPRIADFMLSNNRPATKPLRRMRFA
jgi:poly(3-hydroxybutyrate) depolymerase